MDILYQGIELALPVWPKSLTETLYLRNTFRQGQKVMQQSILTRLWTNMRLEPEHAGRAMKS